MKLTEIDNYADIVATYFKAERGNYGIPTLRLDMQADTDPNHPDTQKLFRWGSRPRHSKHNSCVHFYTADRKFQAVAKDPRHLVKTECPTAVELNLSTNHDTPEALIIASIYIKRWAARYWQEKGIKIFADINVDPAAHKFAFMGIPKGWTSFMTRGYNDYRFNWLDRQFEIAQKIAKKDIIFHVYAGGRKVKRLCKEKNWVWHPTRNLCEHYD